MGMDGYDYGMLCEDVFRLRQDYPCVSVEEAGKSLCGRISVDYTGFDAVDHVKPDDEPDTAEYYQKHCTYL